MQRDAIRPKEPIIADFVDAQLKKARDYIEKELAKPASDSNVPPAPEEAKKADEKKKDEKSSDKKTSSLPVFSVPRDQAA